MEHNYHYHGDQWAKAIILNVQIYWFDPMINTITNLMI